MLGHQIVGRVISGGERFETGDRVGVPWLGWTDGECRYCRSGRENLCDRARFTGYDIDGGYAEQTVADERFCFPIPDELPGPPGRAAPVRRADRVPGAPDGRATPSGSGCTASAPRPTSSPRSPSARAGACSRSRAPRTPSRRRSRASWAPNGPATRWARPPEELDAAIVFAPVGALVPAALRATAKGGSVVCAGIHMSDIPSFPYELLWGERVLRSVANLTRADGERFMALAPRCPCARRSRRSRSTDANEALERLRSGRVRGAAAIMMRDPAATAGDDETGRRYQRSLMKLYVCWGTFPSPRPGATRAATPTTR